MEKNRFEIRKPIKQENCTALGPLKLTLIPESKPVQIMGICVNFYTPHSPLSHNGDLWLMMQEEKRWSSQNKGLKNTLIFKA